MLIIGTLQKRGFLTVHGIQLHDPVSLHIVSVQVPASGKIHYLLILIRKYPAVRLIRYAQLKLIGLDACHPGIKHRLHRPLKIQQIIRLTGITHPVEFFNMVCLLSRVRIGFYEIIVLDTGRLHIIFFDGDQFLRNNLRRHIPPGHQVRTGCDIHSCQRCIPVCRAGLKRPSQLLRLALDKGILVKSLYKIHLLRQIGFIQIIPQAGIIVDLPAGIRCARQIQDIFRACPEPKPKCNIQALLPLLQRVWLAGLIDLPGLLVNDLILKAGEVGVRLSQINRNLFLRIQRSHRLPDNIRFHRRAVAKEGIDPMPLHSQLQGRIRLSAGPHPGPPVADICLHLPPKKIERTHKYEK